MQEVDLLLNDGSKQINVTSRRRSRRCLLMTMALAQTPPSTGKLHLFFAERKKNSSGEQQLAKENKAGGNGSKRRLSEDGNKERPFFAERNLMEGEMHCMDR